MTCPHRVNTEFGVVPAPRRNTRKPVEYVFERQLRPSIPPVSMSKLFLSFGCEENMIFFFFFFFVNAVLMQLNHFNMFKPSNNSNYVLNCTMVEFILLFGFPKLHCCINYIWLLAWNIEARHLKLLKNFKSRNPFGHLK